LLYLYQRFSEATLRISSGLILNRMQKIKYNKARKNILFISVSTKVGGGGSILYDIIRNMKASCKQYNYFMAAPNDGVFFKKTSDLNVKVCDIDMLSINIRSFFQVYRCVVNNDIHLIHTNGKGAGIYGRLIGLILRVPVVHSFHGFHFEHLGFFRRYIYLLSERVLSYLTKRYIFVSNGEREKFLSNIYTSQDKCTVIYNGFDCEKMPKISISKSDIYPLVDSNDILLINLARIVQQKGILELVYASKIVIGRLKNIKFIVFGDVLNDDELNGKDLLYRNTVISTIKELNIEDNFYILPRTDESLIYLKSADIFISTSYGEGFSLSLIEAMMLEIPIIASNVTGNNDAIDHNINGLLVDPMNINDISNTILKLALDKDLKSKLSKNAKDKALRLYSVKEQIRKISDIYKDVLDL
jgi:glycosyltransferase involved in cell wall biosynthesis